MKPQKITMDGRELINRLKIINSKMPSADELNPDSIDLFNLFGELEVLVGMWDQRDAIALNTKIQLFHISPESTYRQIIAIITKTIKAMEIKYPGIKIKQVYAAGEAYDFYNDFKSIVLSAQSSVFLIDPYINEEVFDLYINKIPHAIECRVLLNKINDNLRIIINKLNRSPSRKIVIKKRKKIHDRVVFVDKARCWILGQSINAAAEKMPTYLVELPSDLIHLKLSFYDEIWNKAQLI